ncbi:hypothetical protein ING2E5B_1048 [Fermentimonas caenicola]|jgi:hypothetical protein|uniref:Uncharacterized protein n=1 Tax=Fermentimonas caenicola TaxID=1562970 RepID=A0A098C061_9BACT|nr:hypothetical protein [Lascolabacillus sp.]MDI9626721.1 hypothetical protein [Bacteroidota bacterium]CEA15801.1 hypothetical protein ING2E5B_1048 [Fermentimonas caenicola]
MKQFIYFLSISLLLIGLNACNHQKDNNLNQNSEGYSEASNPTTVQKIDATLLHDKLMSSFSDDWIERESDPDLYPEYYGGSYVDNNGNFVIAVTGNADRNREALKEILNTENFRIETVSYSYRQMMKVMDEIDNFLVSSNIPDNHPMLEKFAGAYPDVMDNRVKVLLTEINNDIINSFKRDVTNSPLIVFEQGEIPELY